MLVITLLSLFIYSISLETQYERELEAHINAWLKPIARTEITWRHEEALEMIPIILKYCKQYNVDPLQVATVISQENSWRQEGLGSAGEIGPMQIMPKWFKRFPLETLDGQLHGGIWWLGQGMKNCKDSARAFDYYNTGRCSHLPSRMARRRDRLYRRAISKYRKRKEF